MVDAIITNVLSSEIKALDDLINHEIINSGNKTISDISSHIISAGGKRLRPKILLLVANAFNYNGASHIKMAAVLELIHTATLLHDDIIDNSDLRRNKVSAHIKWGARDSVNVGDWLFALSFKLTATCNNLDVSNIIASMAKNMAYGELDQLFHKNKGDITKESYYQVITNKTGLLFAIATEIAAVLSEQPKDIVEATRKFGLHLGLAFQIKDDLLDFLGDPKLLGKNVGDDILEGKLTLPMIYLKQRDNGLFNNIMSELKSCKQPENIEQILKKLKVALQATDSLDDAYKMAITEQERALFYLNRLPDNQYRRYLYNITKQVVARVS